MPKWMQMTIASDAIVNHNVLWTLPHHNGEIVCSVMDEEFFNEIHDDKSSAPPPPPWLVKINDGKSSCQCVSASKHALWLLTSRGDVLVRAGISSKQPLGTSWKQLDLVQLGDTVGFLAVGRILDLYCWVQGGISFYHETINIIIYNVIPAGLENCGRRHS